MVSEIRKSFNEKFSNDLYVDYLKGLDSKFPGAIDFRVAETPIFLDKSFTEKVISTCENIVDVITQPNFKSLTHNAVPEELKVPNETNYSDFIAFDFGICENEKGEIEPQLVEMQGFPSLFAFEIWQDEIIRQCFGIPENYSSYFSGLTKDTYLQLLKDIITDGQPVESVILLEILPEKQKTRIDFKLTKEYIGINTICLTELIKEGRHLYYLNNGRKIQIKRIYNRIIFDELSYQSQEIKEKGKILLEDIDVTWIPHPNWFYRISKYTLPFINHQNVPQTTFLDEAQRAIDTFPLKDYVLKPLFSFAGQGVVIDLIPKDIAAIKDPHNWILQRKVNYASIIDTPDELAKAEIRIFYFWPKNAPRPIPTNNLARISKGKMIGVRYNADKKWVGGSIAYFEQ